MPLILCARNSPCSTLLEQVRHVAQIAINPNGYTEIEEREREREKGGERERERESLGGDRGLLFTQIYRI